MEPSILNDYRCDCGKLLFKGSLLSCKLEIKCKRCGIVKTFRSGTQGICSFMFVIDDDGKIMDACNGVSALECSRQYVIGKLLLDILPLARDADTQALLPGPNESKSYQIKNNTLLLRDRKVPMESHIVPIKSGKQPLFRMFNIIKEI